MKRVVVLSAAAVAAVLLLVVRDGREGSAQLAVKGAAARTIATSLPTRAASATASSTPSTTSFRRTLHNHGGYVYPIELVAQRLGARS